MRLTRFALLATPLLAAALAAPGVHAQERLDEGTAAEVVVPRAALLLFPPARP